MSKRRTTSGIDLDNYILATELAHSAGVTPDSVASYGRRHAKRCRGALRHVGGRNYLHVKLAEQYLNRLGLERRAVRPHRWRTLKAVLIDSGAGRSTAVNAIARGELRAVLAGASIYVQPEDAEHFILRHKDLKPLAGWVMVSSLPRELKRSKEAVNQWIRRNRDTVVVRTFLHPTRNRPVPHIREADAERYRKIVASGSEKHVGHAYTDAGSCRDRVLEMVKGNGEPVSGSEVAERLGLAHDRCMRVLKDLFDDGLLAQCGRGTCQHPFSYRMASPDADEHDDPC